MSKKKKAVKKSGVRIRGLFLSFPEKPINKRQANDWVVRAIEKEQKPQFYQVVDKLVSSYIKALKEKGLFNKSGRRHYEYDITFSGDEQELVDRLVQKACDEGDVFAEDFVSTQGKYLPLMADVILPRSRNDDTPVRLKVYVLAAVPSLYTRGTTKDIRQAELAEKKLDDLPEVT